MFCHLALCLFLRHIIAHPLDRPSAWNAVHLPRQPSKTAHQELLSLHLPSPPPTPYQGTLFASKYHSLKTISFVYLLIVYLSSLLSLEHEHQESRHLVYLILYMEIYHEAYESFF